MVGISKKHIVSKFFDFVCDFLEYCKFRASPVPISVMMLFNANFISHASGIPGNLYFYYFQFSANTVTIGALLTPWNSIWSIQQNASQKRRQKLLQIRHYYRITTGIMESLGVSGLLLFIYLKNCGLEYTDKMYCYIICTPFQILIHDFNYQKTYIVKYFGIGDPQLFLSVC